MRAESARQGARRGLGALGRVVASARGQDRVDPVPERLGDRSLVLARDQRRRVARARRAHLGDHGDRAARQVAAEPRGAAGGFRGRRRARLADPRAGCPGARPPPRRAPRRRRPRSAPPGRSCGGPPRGPRRRAGRPLLARAQGEHVPDRPARRRSPHAPAPPAPGAGARRRARRSAANSDSSSSATRPVEDASARPRAGSTIATGAPGLFRRQLGDPAQALAGEKRGEHPGVEIAHRHPVPARRLRAQRMGR